MLSANRFIFLYFIHKHRTQAAIMCMDKIVLLWWSHDSLVAGCKYPVFDDSSKVQYGGANHETRHQWISCLEWLFGIQKRYNTLIVSEMFMFLFHLQCVHCSLCICISCLWHAGINLRNLRIPQLYLFTRHILFTVISCQVLQLFV